jgi:hypothetical protein
MTRPRANEQTEGDQTLLTVHYVMAGDIRPFLCGDLYGFLEDHGAEKMRPSGLCIDQIKQVIPENTGFLNIPPETPLVKGCAILDITIKEQGYADYI